jgi:hypothetical protein
LLGKLELVRSVRRPKMKVEFLLTVRCTPETKGEMIDTFGKTFLELKEGIEAVVAKEDGVLQLPSNMVAARFVAESGRWD